jgi:crotonobetainyl-CoA:carnitine CoA-transferase CaiB-like acyl-CoA transferase
MTWPTDPALEFTGPLAGVRVLDLARIIAGPLASLYLADLGADVIKVERPTGDEMRAYGPEKWQGVGSTFLALNRNKRSVTLDLNDGQGREALLKLVADADVLIESYRPGIMARWGLTFDRLREVNSALIYCSITGFGGSGPAAGLGANNLIAEAFGGTMSVSESAEASMRTGAPMTDYFTGTAAALAVVSRLITPREERAAVHIQTSLLESQSLMMSGYVIGYLATGVDPTPESGLPFTVPNQVFRASDGRIVLAANSETMWQRLCHCVGLDEWLAKPEYATNALRMQRQEEIVSRLDGVLAQNTRAHWLRIFDEARVTAGPVNSVGALLEHPQVEALQLLEPVPGHAIDDLVGLRLPFTFDGESAHPGAHRPPPTLGADNALLDTVASVERAQ